MPNNYRAHPKDIKKKCFFTSKDMNKFMLSRLIPTNTFPPLKCLYKHFFFHGRGFLKHFFFFNYKYNSGDTYWVGILQSICFVEFGRISVVILKRWNIPKGPLSSVSQSPFLKSNAPNNTCSFESFIKASTSISVSVGVSKQRDVAKNSFERRW